MARFTGNHGRAVRAGQSGAAAVLLRDIAYLGELKAGMGTHITAVQRAIMVDAWTRLCSREAGAIIGAGMAA